MMNSNYSHPSDKNIQEHAHGDVKRNLRTELSQRIGIFTRILIILGLAAFLFGLIEVLVSSIQLGSATYKDAVEQYHVYADLHYKYQMIDLDIAERRSEAKADDNRTKKYWQERRKKDETEWNERWEDFNSLVIYYSQSADRMEMLEAQTEEYSYIASGYSNIESDIRNDAEERSYAGDVFMGIGGALIAVGIIKLLRDLQLLGRFSRMTKYR